MDRYRALKDVVFTDEGDFSVDDVDLVMANSKPYEAFINRVMTRINSKIGDWKARPFIGMPFTQYTGGQNTAGVGARIKTDITNGLLGGGFISAGELEVEVAPLSKDIIVFIIIVSPRGAGSSIILSYSYDMRNSQLVQRHL